MAEAWSGLHALLFLSHSLGVTPCSSGVDQLCKIVIHIQ